MTHEYLYRYFQALAPREKARLLSRLGHNLTVAARDASGAIEPAGAVRKLLALNELQHTVTGKLIALTGDDPEAFPDEDFLEVLFEMAQRSGCEADLLQALRWSLPAEAYAEPQGRERTSPEGRP